METEQGFAEVNGTKLYYEQAGTGEVVVLIHGFTLSTAMWDDQFIPLAQQFKVVRYDMRGFGQSAVPTTQPYTHFEDLKALLEALNISQAYLVGLSKGGAVALDFALTYPEQVLGLVLIDTVLGGFSWSAEGSQRDGLVWQEARLGGIPAAKKSWLAHPLFVPAYRQPQVAHKLEQIIEAYSGWHFINPNPEQGLEPPAAGRLSQLTMPILAIAGEEDTPDFLKITALISQQTPHVRQVVLPKVGHMANMEAPQKVNQAILEFLTSLPS